MVVPLANSCGAGPAVETRHEATRCPCSIASPRSSIDNDCGVRNTMVRVPARAGQDAAQAVFESMRARSVLVKNVSKMHSLLADCLRLTVGTADENTQLLAALKASL